MVQIILSVDVDDASCLSDFISHMVQIILCSSIEHYNAILDFISHMVQIIQRALYKKKNVLGTLYPTWFR